MAHLKQLIHEIHRRSLWQVLGIYLLGSWLVLQVVDTLAGALNLPEWAPPLALFLLIIGLPIVLATAFIQVGTARPPPEQAGEREQETGAPQEGTRHRLFTWRNALAGGVAAFALLGVVAASDADAAVDQLETVLANDPAYRGLLRLTQSGILCGTTRASGRSWNKEL